MLSKVKVFLLLVLAKLRERERWLWALPNIAVGWLVSVYLGLSGWDMFLVMMSGYACNLLGCYEMLWRRRRGLRGL